MLTSTVLNRAADEIERRGWVGLNTHTDDPWGGGAGSDAPVCLEGGIAAAMGLRVSADPELNVDLWSDLETCPAYRAVESYLEWEVGGALYKFNDIEARTQAEVIEVLRAAAAIEQAREAEVALVDAVSL